MKKCEISVILNGKRSKRADSVTMNIITYHASGAESVAPRASAVRASESPRPRSIPLTAVFECAVGHSASSAFCVGRATPRAVYRAGVFLQANFLPFLLIFSTLYAALSIPLLQSGKAHSYSIRALPFIEEPAFVRARQAYLFPEQGQAGSLEQEGLAVQEGGAASASSEAAQEGQQVLSKVSFREYRVKKGDTISGIALRSGLRNFGTVLQVNKIDNAHGISVGEVLRIPSTDGLLHTVKKNEHLAGIASFYKVPVTVLLDANDLKQETLSIGQELFIPGAALSTYELRKALGELFIYPIKGRLTSPFGYRSDPFTGAKSFHSGIDLAAPTGTAVKVTLDGKVAETGLSRIFGNYIIVSHEKGYQSLYGHLSAIYVKRGQSLRQGAVIGAVGNTGYSTGPHLHLSIYKNGHVINPFSVLK